jgi:hypothetical protein
VAAALGGCGSGRSGPVTDGPLSSGSGIHDPGSRITICAPGGRSYAFGLDSFTNYGHTTVILDRFVLIHPRNQHLIAGYVVPGDSLVGDVYWPPGDPGWKDRRPVPGFRVAPGKTFNLVLGLVAITRGRRAISMGELVYYHDASGSYVANSNSVNVIAAGPSTKNC